MQESSLHVDIVADTTVDAVDLACPMPLLKAKQAMNALNRGQVLKVIATDPGSLRDFPAWCELSGHRLLNCEEKNSRFLFYLQKN